MSHFYGVVQGARGDATRAGSKASGLTATAASWAGAVKTELYVDDDGDDAFVVYQIPWHGQGIRKELVRGKIGQEE